MEQGGEEDQEVAAAAAAAELERQQQLYASHSEDDGEGQEGAEGAPGQPGEQHSLQEQQQQQWQREELELYGGDSQDEEEGHASPGGCCLALCPHIFGPAAAATGIAAVWTATVSNCRGLSVLVKMCLHCCCLLLLPGWCGVSSCRVC
jgi:hypothetical protein